MGSDVRIPASRPHANLDARSRPPGERGELCPLEKRDGVAHGAERVGMRGWERESDGDVRERERPLFFPGTVLWVFGSATSSECDPLASAGRCTMVLLIIRNRVPGGEGAQYGMAMSRVLSCARRGCLWRCVQCATAPPLKLPS